MRQLKQKEHYSITAYLKVESTSVFQDVDTLGTLNNPKYPIAFETNYLLIQLELWVGAVGIQGKLSLILPPVEEDITDCWDFCRLAGKWDIWSFLNFQYQYDENLDPSIFINYTKGNFFEVDLEVYKIIKLEEICTSSDDYSMLSDILSSQPQHIEFPENVGEDFDYKKYYIELVADNFIELLQRIWKFEIIINPMEQN